MSDVKYREPNTDNAPRSRPSNASQGMTLFVMVVATLYFGREVLVPVTLALFLAFILAPLVALLRRFYLPRVPAVLIAVLLALTIISSIGGVIGTQIAELATDLPKYIETVEQKIATVKQYTVGQLSTLANSIGHHGDAASNLANVMPGLSNPASSSGSSPGMKLPQGSSPLDLAERYLAPVLSPLADLGIIFVIAVFALLQKEDLRDRLIRLIGSGDLHRTTLAIDEAGTRLSRYFVTQLTINTLFGVVVGTGLLIIGIPNPVLWGILSALLRFVPYVGSLMSAILPLAVAAAIDPGWSAVIATATLYAVSEGITGQAIEPMVYGHSTGISPFSVVVAAIFWSWLWGPVGLILSTPLTLCLVVLGRHSKKFAVLDVMLGDGAPLTSVESFYQRVLAGDADETLDQAERYLKEHSLLEYYDDVAIKGLQIAANDGLRGALSEEQLDQIKKTVWTLIQGLDRVQDKKAETVLKPEDGPVGLPPRKTETTDASAQPEIIEAPAGEAKGSILCVAGRGLLDECAAGMLAQLLEKQGLRSRYVAFSEVSRDNITRFDGRNATTVNVSYLDVSGTPAHLRYLVQRLRHHVPLGTPLFVGAFPETEVALGEANAQKIGADALSGSFKQALSLTKAEADKRASAASENAAPE